MLIELIDNFKFIFMSEANKNPYIYCHNAHKKEWYITRMHRENHFIFKLHFHSIRYIYFSSCQQSEEKDVKK